MRDFFARQEDARRRSFRLVILFSLAVAGVVLSVYFAAALVVFWLFPFMNADSLWHPRLFFWTSGLTLLFVCAGSLLKMSELRQGGSRIAEILGGRLVLPTTEDPHEQRLRNVMEEMAIASGVPVPDLYLLENERGINAFAAGYGLDDAVVCVTRGALELLDRDELQAVVAHEFSHIINGDMRLNLRLLGWLNGILMVGEMGESVFRGVGRVRGRSAGPLLLGAGALFVVGYVGYFFGRLIKSAVSRQREYLGDASSVQFTRNPHGLADALKKIGGLSSGSRIDHPRAGEVSHMFFSNSLSEAWLQALDTHPPLPERIKRLDPSFDGTFPKVQPLPPPPVEAMPANSAARKAPLEMPVLSGAAVAALLEQVGAPLQAHLDAARRIMNDIPPPLMSATRDPFGAISLVYCLLLDRDPAIRQRQMEMVAVGESEAMAEEVRRLAADVENLPPEVRLPLLDLSMPALRSLSREQFQQLKKTTASLTSADGRTTLFEFALGHLLLRHLESRFNPGTRKAAQIYGIRGVQQQSSCVLSVLARAGQQDEASAREAFARGVRVLQEPKAEFALLPASECGLANLQGALSLLDSASPAIKRRLLAASLECLLHDGVVKTSEVELFRGIADAVGCPLPPWLTPGGNGGAPG